MNYEGLKFTNKADKTVEIDVEGFIGFDPYDSPAEQIATKEKMKAELKKLAELKADTILVNINSYGGDVNHGISIHDLLAESKARIITKINGMTASAATIIAMAGNERKMSDNALFLVHDASTFAWGNKNDIKETLGELETIDGRLLNIYTKATGKSSKEITDLMEENNGNGKWITADKAKKMGFITDKFEPMHAAAHFSNDILQRFGLPPAPEKYQAKEIPNNDKMISNIANQVVGKIKELFNQNNKPQKQMKKFEAINKALDITELASTDEGVFLNEEQLEKINSRLAEKDQNEENLQAAQAAGKETQKNLDSANLQIQQLTADMEELRNTAGATTATVIKENDQIVEENKDKNIVSEKKSFVENLSAIAEEFNI